MLQESQPDGAVLSARTPAARLRILHVLLQAGPTNSQWNEHCVPVADERDLTVCSLFPATVAPDPRITRFEGDGSVWGALEALRASLRAADYDAVHVHAPPSAAMLVAACALERRRLGNAVMTLHTTWPDLRLRSKMLAVAAFAVLPTVVACGRASSESIPRPVRHLARRGVDVVPNGVDVDRLDRALATVEPEAGHVRDGRAVGGFTVLTVGRLVPEKDHEALLSAFARMSRPTDRLLIVGEGPCRPALEERIATLGITDQVRLTGLMPRDDVYRLLGSADVFVSPSRGEGLPVAVLEAMAAGLPVVLSDIEPHREIVGGQDLAAVVPIGDVAGLADEMRRLRSLAARERAALGARGRARVLGEFSLRAMTDGYHEVYSTITTARRTQ
ncbi:MAG TPA: glycosyltransferase family 4 protein [Nocardioidaceae bacterium]|nr:glycosyltransferase family 4 protein [Nocardioidaceae bacterium]